MDSRSITERPQVGLNDIFSSHWIPNSVLIGYYKLKCPWKYALGNYLMLYCFRSHHSAVVLSSDDAGSSNWSHPPGSVPQPALNIPPTFFVRLVSASSIFFHVVLLDLSMPTVPYVLVASLFICSLNSSLDFFFPRVCFLIPYYPHCAPFNRFQINKNRYHIPYLTVHWDE